MKPEFIRSWRKLGGEALHIWPDLMPRNQPGEDFARLAGQYYDAGADGFCFWDGERRRAHISEWAAVQQLGHRHRLDRIIETAPGHYKRIPLKYLGGFSAEHSFHDG